MKFVVYGEDRLIDTPARITVLGKSRDYEIDITDDQGVIIAPGAGITVVALFRAPGETVKDLWRYRHKMLISWEDVTSINFHFPDPKDVPADVWPDAMEKIAPEKPEEPDQKGEVRTVKH